MKIKYLFSALLGAALFASCNSDSETTGKQYIDIATLESTGSAGTVFSLRQMGDSPLVTLLAQQPVDKEIFTEGSRVVIQYAADEPYKSGNITLMGISNTFGKGEEAPDSTAAATSNWASAKVDARAIWRTGDYVNMQFQASTAGEPKQCKLVFDELTMSSDYPSAHLIFEASPGADVRNYIFYASFGIGKYWNIEGIKGIKVFYKDASSVTNSDASVTIIKDKNQLTPNE